MLEAYDLGQVRRYTTGYRDRAGLGRATAKGVDRASENHETDPAMPLDFHTPQVPQDRKAALCGLMNVAQDKGLEFGPLTRPIVAPCEGDIRFVDVMDTEALKHQFRSDQTHPQDKFVPVRYVWPSCRDLNAVVDGERFDYALSSHAIEHVPDVIGWLRSIADVLEDGGLYGMAIPDKRFTFDLPRRTTTTAQLIDHWFRAATRPTPEQVYDHFSQVTKVASAEVFGLHRGEILPGCYERHHTDECAYWMAEKARDSDEYINIHASVFTPESFLNNIRDLSKLGILDVEIADFYDTAENNIEFVCVLRKAKSVDIDGQIDRIIAGLRPTPYAI